MKRKFVMLSLVLLINAGAFAQKDQIKSAQSLFDSGKSQEALGILTKNEYLIHNSSDDDKSDFYFLKGNVLKELASKKIDVDVNLSASAEAYQQLIKYESESGKFKYTLQANVALRDLKSKFIASAMEDYSGGKFKESASKNYKAYLYDKKDTTCLYNAAAAALNAKDYDSAIKYYEELKNINYSGKGKWYFAINKKSKQEERFASEADRATSIATGLYDKPKDVVTPSRKLEINKNLAYVCLEKNELTKAEQCYSRVLELDPNYIDAYINLAYIKLQSKKTINDEMNALGNSPKEMEMYEKLKVKRDNLIKSSIPYLKKALVIEPKNQDVMKSLLGVYRSLEMTAEYDSLKATM